MTQAVQVEIERKYDVDGQASLPRLNGAGGVAQVRYRPPVALEAVYFDTPDRALSANRVTLRRRTGGTDAGWHVKIGTGDRRIELHVPLSRKDTAGLATGETSLAGITVPEQILELVHVHVRRKTLVPIARLNTLRSVVDLMDPAGHRVAEVCDDQVAAMAVGRRAESRVQHWREWELEVVDADAVEAAHGGSGGSGAVTAFLDAVGQLLEAAGARPSESSSKVQKVVGTVTDPLDPALTPDAGPLGVGAVLTATVRAQLRSLKAWDPLVRADVTDSVHQYRVTCRTLRSVLQTYAPLLAEEPTAAVIRDLKKLGALLSVARDAEVVRDLVSERIQALPGGTGGPVARRIPGKTLKRLRRVKADEYAAAHARQVKRMSSGWYADVLDRLEAFATAVPLRGTPEDSAEGGVEQGAVRSTDSSVENSAVDAMVPLAADQVDSVLALGASVGSEEDADRRLELMHDVRREAKRLRYAVKAVQDATGLDLGAELVARMKTAKKLQESLGEHRDSVMFQEHVLATSVKAAEKGEDAFGYGVLYAAEFPVQARAEEQARHLVARLGTRSGA